MDRKKRAQVVWGALAALLALLFLPNLSLGRDASGEPSPDPAPDETTDEQTDPNESGEEQPADEGAESPSDGGWFEDDDSDAPEGTVPGEGGVADPGESGDGGWGQPADPQEPDAPDDGSSDPGGHPAGPGVGVGGDVEYGNDDGAEDGGTPPDDGEPSGDGPASGYPGHYDPEDGHSSGYDIPGFSREDALQGDPDLTWTGELAEDVVEWAGDNPEKALLITGASALTGGYAYMAYSAASGSAWALTASQAARLSPAAVPMVGMGDLPAEFRDKLEAVAEPVEDTDESPQESQDDAGGGGGGDFEEEAPAGTTPGDGGYVDPGWYGDDDSGTNPSEPQGPTDGEEYEEEAPAGTVPGEGGVAPVWGGA